MKTSLLAELYRKLGEGLGLLEPVGEEAVKRSEADIERGREAVRELQKLQERWREQGITVEDIRGFISEGRR